MGDEPEPGAGALGVSLAYFRAWTARDSESAMTFIDDDIVCDATSGKLDGVAAFRRFMEPFTHILTRAELIAAFADDHAALLMYDADTVPSSMRRAECHTVDNGKITHITIVFDRQPFTEAPAAADAS